jgi:hypothetical protein
VLVLCALPVNFRLGVKLFVGNAVQARTHLVLLVLHHAHLARVVSSANKALLPVQVVHQESSPAPVLPGARYVLQVNLARKWVVVSALTVLLAPTVE